MYKTNPTYINFIDFMRILGNIKYPKKVLDVEKFIKHFQTKITTRLLISYEPITCRKFKTDFSDSSLFKEIIPKLKEDNFILYFDEYLNKNKIEYENFEDLINVQDINVEMMEKMVITSHVFIDYLKNNVFKFGKRKKNFIMKNVYITAGICFNNVNEQYSNEDYIQIKLNYKKFRKLQDGLFPKFYEFIYQNKPIKNTKPCPFLLIKSINDKNVIKINRECIYCIDEGYSMVIENYLNVLKEYLIYKNNIISINSKHENLLINLLNIKFLLCN